MDLKPVWFYQDGFASGTTAANAHVEVPDGAPVVVYLHGGAYVNEIVSQHWDLVAELATDLQRKGYRIIPVNPMLREPLFGEQPTRRQLGLLGVRVPEAYGGSAAGAVAYVLALSEIAAAATPPLAVETLRARIQRAGRPPFHTLTPQQLVNVREHYSVERLRPEYKSFEMKPLFLVTREG